MYYEHHGILSSIGRKEWENKEIKLNENNILDIELCSENTEIYNPIKKSNQLNDLNSIEKLK